MSSLYFEFSGSLQVVGSLCILSVQKLVLVVSSACLTRTSCCKETHSSDYYRAWPGQAVSGRWLQYRNDAQLWMCLVMKIKSDVAKNSNVSEPGMLGP